MKKFLKRLLVLVLVAALICGSVTGYNYWKTKNAKPVSVYNVSELSETDYWMDSAESYGSVRSDKTQSVFLSSTQRVSEIKVQEGQSVLKGDVLMTYDTTLSKIEVEKKQLEVQQMEQELKKYQSDLEKVKKYRPGKKIPKKDQVDIDDYDFPSHDDIDDDDDDDLRNTTAPSVPVGYLAISVSSLAQYLTADMSGVLADVIVTGKKGSGGKKTTEASEETKKREAKKGETKASETKAAKKDQKAANAVIKKIDALPSKAGTDDEEKIVKARKAYDDLTSAQKKLISKDELKKLTTAEKQLAKAQQKAADKLIEKIEELPDPVTLEDEKAVMDIREAYDKMSDTQKELITKEALKKLKKAEKQLLNANTKKINSLMKKIEELPDPAGAADEKTVKKARAAFDALTDVQKEMIGKKELKNLSAKLKTAEKQVEEAKKATETTEAADPGETTTAADPGETTTEAAPEETTTEADPEETTTEVTPEETTTEADPEETTKETDPEETTTEEESEEPATEETSEEVTTEEVTTEEETTKDIEPSSEEPTEEPTTEEESEEPEETTEEETTEEETTEEIETSLEDTSEAESETVIEDNDYPILEGGKGKENNPFIYHWNEHCQFTQEFLAYLTQGRKKAYITIQIVEHEDKEKGEEGELKGWFTMLVCQENGEYTAEILVLCVEDHTYDVRKYGEDQGQEEESTEDEEEEEEEEEFFAAYAAKAKKGRAKLKLLSGKGSKKNPYHYKWNEDIVLTQKMLETLTRKAKSAYENILILEKGDTEEEPSAFWNMKSSRVKSRYEWQLLKIGVGSDEYDFTKFNEETTEESTSETDTGDYPDPPYPDPDDDDSVTYTKEEIAEMLSALQENIRDLDLELRMARVELEKKQRELNDGAVYCTVDGKVAAVRNAEEARAQNKALIEVSGGGGYYINGTVSELELGSVAPGQSIEITSYETGTSCNGEVLEISDFPASSDSYWDGSGNSNVSYYPFKVFAQEGSGLRDGEYVELKYEKASTNTDSFYLINAMIRSENGSSYVYKRGKDGLLKKQKIRTGKSIWGEYTEVLSGLTLDDMVAFPYGDTVVEGAKTEEADVSDLYDYSYG